MTTHPGFTSVRRLSDLSFVRLKYLARVVRRAHLFAVLLGAIVQVPAVWLRAEDWQFTDSPPPASASAGGKKSTTTDVDNNCGCSNCDEGEGCAAFGPTPWFAAADALWLQRSLGANNSLNLGNTLTNPGGALVDTLSTSDSNFNMQAGARFEIGYRLNDCTSIEGEFFGFQQWDTGRTIGADSVGLTSLAFSPLLQLGTAPFGGFDTGLGFSYSSRLENCEFNVRRLVSTNANRFFSVLAGVRYFGLDEKFNLTGSDQFAFGGQGSENLATGSHNDLVGFQLGSRLDWSWTNFDLQFEGKAGFFANFIHQSRADTATGTPPGFVATNNSNSTTGAAGIVDFSALGVYRVRPHIALRAGYQVLYVPGLALAPSQMTTFSHSGDVFMHGPSAGLEFTWGGI